MSTCLAHRLVPATDANDGGEDRTAWQKAHSGQTPDHQTTACRERRQCLAEGKCGDVDPCDMSWEHPLKKWLR